MSGHKRAWHVAIHARPPGVRPGPSIACGKDSLPTLLVPPETQAELLPVSFEAAAARLQACATCSVEPDGALLWVSPPGSEPSWQLDGQLWDRQDRLWALEIRGWCPQPEWDRLLAALGWPHQPLMLRLVREAVFLDEPVFRRIAYGT